MAITRGDIFLWDELRKRDLIPPMPNVLEIGEANWFGDVDPPAGIICERMDDPFTLAKAYYRKVLNYKSILAIDLQGKDAIKADLNQPINLPNQFDIVINSGTAEHVFNQAQVFKTVHDWTRTGGLMVHAVPVRGFFGHGLYNYNPVFFRLLAEANGYDIPLVFLFHFDRGIVAPQEKEPVYPPDENVMLYLAMVKKSDKPFVYPIQREYRTPGD